MTLREAWRGLLALGLVAASASDKTVTLEDGQPAWIKGPYSAYLSPWAAGAEGIRRGTDYADRMTIRPSSFPDGTVIDTRWPTHPLKKGGVWGYHAVSFGNYDAGKTDLDRFPVAPQRVRDIRTFSESFSLSYEGSDRFNLLNEFYLTAEPGTDRKLVEIGFLLHTPPRSLAFVYSGEPIARFADRNKRRWMATRHGTYITIIPENGADVLRGQIDIHRVLTVLRDVHAITGDEWFNGIAIGTEPIEGAGTSRITLSHWRVAFR